MECNNTEYLVYAKFGGSHQVALLGKAVNDPRYDAETGAYAEGHRIVTSTVITVVGGEYHTANTIYYLDLDEQNQKYKEWCDNH